MRRRHVPQRTCVGCRQVLSKRAMIRLVRTPDGVRIDPSGKIPGRGAYVHDKESCWQAALRGSLERALKTNISSESRLELEAYMENLTDEADP